MVTAGPVSAAAPPWKMLAATLAALTLLRLWSGASSALVPDESYYWLWSRVPSAGYYDHPPMIAWWIWAATRLLGDTAFAVRLLPVLSVLVAALAVAGTARELFGPLPLASRAALWFNATLLIGAGAFIATPDAPSIMFWALTTWALAALRRTGRPSLWLLVGLLAGLGGLSKYTNLFFGLGIVVWLVTDRNARRWFASPWLWAGGAVAFVVFLPNLLWNADHQWLTFAKQFGRIDEHGASRSHVLEFFAGQFGLLNPVLAIFAILGVVRAFRTAGEGAGARFLVALSAPLFVYMCVHSLHDRVQGNWPGPLYAAAALLAAFGAAPALPSGNLERLARSVVPVGFGISSVILAWAAMASAMPLPFDSAADRLFGWQALADQVRQDASSSGAGWVAVFSYDVGAELAWHLRGPGADATKDPVQVVDLGNRARYGFLRQDSALAGRRALLVVTEGDMKRGRLDACFTDMHPLGTIARSSGARVIERYVLIAATPAKPDLIATGCP